MEHAATPDGRVRAPARRDRRQPGGLDRPVDRHRAAVTPARWSVAPPGRPVAFLAVLLRLAGRQHRRRGPARRRTAGTSAASGRCSATPSCGRSRGSRCGRRRPPRALTLAVALPAAHVLATLRVPRATARSRRCSSCPSCCRPWWWGRRSSRCSAPAALLGVDLRGSAVGDPAGPRLLQPRRRGPHRREPVGGPRPEHRGGRPGAGRVARGGPSPSVTWPAIRPAVASAAAIVFLFTFTQLRCRPHPRRPRRGRPSRPRSTGRPRTCSTCRSRRCSPCCSWRRWWPCSRCTAGSSGGRRPRPSRCGRPCAAAVRGRGRPGVGRRPTSSLMARLARRAARWCSSRARSGSATATGWRDGERWAA